MKDQIIRKECVNDFLKKIILVRKSVKKGVVK